MDYYWICFATPPIQFTPKKVKGYCAITTFTGMEISPVTRCVFFGCFLPKDQAGWSPPSCVHEKIWPHCSWFCPKTLLATSFWDTLFIIFLLVVAKKYVFVGYAHDFLEWIQSRQKKNPKISHDSWSSGIDFVSAPKETMIELVQVLLSQVDRRPCWAKLIKMSGMLSLEADKQCPAGTRTWPATRYFFRYPTRFSFRNQRVAGNPKHRVLPDISGKPEVS